MGKYFEVIVKRRNGQPGFPDLWFNILQEIEESVYDKIGIVPERTGEKTRTFKMAEEPNKEFKDKLIHEGNILYVIKND